MQTLCLIVGRHWKLAAEASLHTLTFQFVDQLITACNSTDVVCKWFKVRCLNNHVFSSHVHASCISQLSMREWHRDPVIPRLEALENDQLWVDILTLFWCRVLFNRNDTWSEVVWGQLAFSTRYFVFRTLLPFLVLRNDCRWQESIIVVRALCNQILYLKTQSSKLWIDPSNNHWWLLRLSVHLVVLILDDILDEWTFFLDCIGSIEQSPDLPAINLLSLLIITAFTSQDISILRHGLPDLNSLGYESFLSSASTDIVRQLELLKLRWRSIRHVSLPQHDEIVLLYELKIKDFLVWIEGLDKEGVIIDRDRLSQIIEVVFWRPVHPAIYPSIELLIVK